MFGFIHRWLTGRPAPQGELDPYPTAPAALPIPPSLPTLPTSSGAASPTAHRHGAPALPSHLPTVILRREEIIDARTRIAGYRFKPQCPDTPTYARAAFEALGASRVAEFAERRIALFPVSAEFWFQFDYVSLIGAHTVVLLDRPPTDPAHLEQWRSVAKAIRDAGARVALSDLDLAQDNADVWENADLLLIDFSSYSMRNFERHIMPLKHQYPRLQIIADNVGSWPERRYCVSLGVAHCIGAFSAGTDDEQQAGEFNQGRLVIVEMLNLLRRDADLVDLAEIAKRDPGLAVKILAMANSPLVGLTQAISSIEQAIVVLGREQLYRWLSIAMFRLGTGSPRDEVLLELALDRGRFLELLGGKHHDKAKCEELFLVGMLSLLDSMLGVPMATVLASLHLSPEMHDVLLHTEGPLRPYLLLAIAVQKGQAESIDRLARLLAVSDEDIAVATNGALSWTQHAMQLGK